MRKALFGVLTLLLLLNMGFIYYQSAQTGEESSAISSAVTEEVVEVIMPTINEKPQEEKESILAKFHSIIRTLAHGAEFALLGGLVYAWLATYKKTSPLNPYLRWGMSVLFAGLYGLLDECHQLFVDDRAFSMADVGIDTLGAFIGAGGMLCLVWICTKLYQMRKPIA